MDPIKTLITTRPNMPADITIETPKGVADVEVVSMSWWKQVLIRTARTYLQSVLGTITALSAGPAVIGATVSIQAADAMRLAIEQFGGVIASALVLAIMPAVITLIQNLIELLTKLDTSNPKFRA